MIWAHRVKKEHDTRKLVIIWCKRLTRTLSKFGNVMVARCALPDVRISYCMLLPVRRSSSCDNVLEPLRHEGYLTLKINSATFAANYAYY